MLQMQCENAAWARSLDGARLGFDLVQISQVADSLARFGHAYERRVFTEDEQAYARQGEAVQAERLAARLAAKEAVIKALKLPEAGVALTDIEVVKREDGDCDIHLHGRVADIAQRKGVRGLLLSLSHDGDYAGAFVSVLFGNQPRQEEAS
jgi:holo-[acyl-carrier protein] synthase